MPQSWTNGPVNGFNVRIAAAKEGGHGPIRRIAWIGPPASPARLKVKHDTHDRHAQ